ncbi:MAG: baseplate J/gp47 family protein [Dehalococcoidia bacterium]|jgi:hypothetical protein
MVNNIINFIVGWLKEHRPKIAYAKGTGVFDLFIHAVAEILDYVYRRIDAIAAATNPAAHNDMSETQLDAIGGMVFLPRNTGGFARTVQRIYFSSPSRIVIPVGWRVGMDLIFATTEKHEFSASRVQSQRIGNEYYIQFTVQAIAQGDQYNVDTGMISDIKDPLYAQWTRTTNIVPATGGVIHEDNEAYHARMSESVNTRDLLITKGSVRTTLMRLFPSIDEVHVEGKGDPHMERDIHFGLTGPGGFAPYFASTFIHKISGSISSNPNEAYKFSSEVDIDEITTEMLENVAVELSTDEYRQIAVLDQIHFTHYSSRLFSDFFPSTKRDFKLPDWVVSDSGLPFGQKRYDDSVYEQQGLRMGKPDSTTSAPV